MTRAQLEHLLRAAATIADDDEIVVIGSQAILGQFPEAPGAAKRSPRQHNRQHKPRPGRTQSSPSGAA